MILDQIVQNSRIELTEHQRRMPLKKIKELALTQPKPKDLVEALKGERVKLIAEVKKASPSRGVICQDFDPVKIARIYADNGASAISVLTENKHFQGSLEYLADIRIALGENRPPLLRKDFIFDPYQVYESLTYGADALLLIVAILKYDELVDLLTLSHELNLKCLVEAHNEDEVKMAIKSRARIIGINNRNLQDFSVDVQTTLKLRPLIPPDRIVISESGIKTSQEINLLKSWKVNAILVGETLISSVDIPAKMRELL